MNNKNNGQHERKKVFSIVFYSLSAFLFFVLCINSFASCNSVEKVNTKCYEQVTLTNNCNYVNIFNTNNIFYDTIQLNLDNNLTYNYTLQINDSGSYTLKFCDGVTYTNIRIVDNVTRATANKISYQSGINNKNISQIEDNISATRVMTLGLLIFIWLGCAFIGLRFKTMPFTIISGLMGIALGVLLATWVFLWLGLVVIFMNIAFIFFGLKH